jgi:hypothetical protein
VGKSCAGGLVSGEKILDRELDAEGHVIGALDDVVMTNE